MANLLKAGYAATRPCTIRISDIFERIRPYSGFGLQSILPQLRSRKGGADDIGSQCPRAGKPGGLKALDA